MSQLPTKQSTHLFVVVKFGNLTDERDTSDFGGGWHHPLTPCRDGHRPTEAYRTVHLVTSQPSLLENWRKIWTKSGP